MEIQIKGDDGDAVKAMARRLIAQNPDFSPAYDKSMGGGFIATIKTKSKLEGGK